MGGKTESTAERCERLETMIGNLSKSYSKLASQYNMVEKTNQEILSRLADKSITPELLQGGGPEGRPPEAMTPGDSKRLSSNSILMARVEALESQQVILLSQTQRSSEENHEANKTLEAKLEQQEKGRRQIEDLMAEEVEFAKENIREVRGKVEEINENMESMREAIREGKNVAEIFTPPNLIKEQLGEIEAIKSRLSALELEASRDQTNVDKIK